MNKSLLALSILSLAAIAATPASFANQIKSYHFRSPVNHSVVSAIPADKNLSDLSELLHDKYLFALRDPKSGRITYTRSGNFILMDGYFYQSGKRLQGYNISTEIMSNSCQLSDIHFAALLPPSATANENMRLNLNATSVIPSQPFNPADTNTYNYSVSSAIYDSLGEQHVMHTFFVKSEASVWTVYVTIDDGSTLAQGSIAFATNGTLSKTEGLSGIIFSPSTGATSPQLFSLSLDGSTQYGSPNSLEYINQDGHGVSHLAVIQVDEIGYVNQQYTNGEEVTAGKIAVLQNVS